MSFISSTLPGRILHAYAAPSSEESLIKHLITGINVTGATVFLILLFLPAPFGRFYNKKWGPPLNGKISWFIFEIMSPISFTYSFLHPLAITAPHDPVKLQHNPFTWLFFAMYITHYAHRSIIYPLTAPHMSPSSILAASMAFVYNICNGYINGRSLSVFSDFSDADLRRPTFWIGLTLFFFGLYTNIKADHMVFALRRNRDAKAEASTDPKLRYSIPRGFLFDFISCPNYFGEIVEWIGFALATKSPAAWNFAIFTFANLFPRALSTHKWYKETFGDSYPKDRKAAIPFVL